MTKTITKPLSPSSKSPFLSGSVQLFEIPPPPFVSPRGKGKNNGRLNSIALVRHARLGCVILGCIFGVSSLLNISPQNLYDEPQRRMLAEAAISLYQQTGLHLRGNLNIPEKYIPVSCPGVMDRRNTGILLDKDSEMHVDSQKDYDPNLPALDNIDFNGARLDAIESDDHYWGSLSGAIADILKTSPPNAHVLNIGEGADYYSLLSASNDLIVDSFEPSPQNRLILCEYLHSNRLYISFDPKPPKVNLYPFGVGKEEGVFPLHESEDYKHGNSVEKTINGQDGFRVVALDKFAKDHEWFGTRPDIAILMMGVEGVEAYNVLLGALELIKSRMIQNIFMKVSAKTPKELELKKAEIDLLVQAGYKLHKVDGWSEQEKEVGRSAKREDAGQVKEAIEEGGHLSVWWTL